MIVAPQAQQPWASAAITRVTPKRAPRVSQRSKPAAAEVPTAPAVDEFSGLDRLSLMQDDAPVPRAESVRNEVWPTDGAWLREGARKPETVPAKDESPVHEAAPAPPKAPVRAAEVEAPPPSAAGHKVAAIEALYVEGALPQGVVSRGVSRLLPQYERCSEFCDSETQRLKLSTVIDEAGHGRRVVVEGPSQPGLRRCLEQATAHLAVPAPDTGTARARWIVRFANE